MGTKSKTVITIETRKVTLIKRVSAADMPNSDSDPVERAQSGDGEVCKQDSEVIDHENEIRALLKTGEDKKRGE